MSQSNQKNFSRGKRHLSNARRELRKAVERFAGIDALRGHRVEALRLAREARDEAHAAVEKLGGGNG